MFLLKSARLLNSFRPAVIQYEQHREIKRWLAPVRREFNKRKKKMGPEPITPRSSFLEWNYHAEIFAFNKRLNESMDLAVLQQAFTHRSYIIQEEAKQRDLGLEHPVINLKDNRELIDTGERYINDYTIGFLKYSLSKMPNKHLNAIHRNLTSETALADIALNLGMGDLVLCSVFPAQLSTLADTFKAVVGCIGVSSGDLSAYTFVRDFLCTQLNQTDLVEICHIENPFDELKLYCEQNGMGEPEARLIGETAKNTVLAACNVAIYSDKKFIGSGFGENLKTATETAAYNVLRNMWGFAENLKPYNFKIEVEDLSKEKLIRVS